MINDWLSKSDFQVKCMMVLRCEDLLLFLLWKEKKSGFRFVIWKKRSISPTAYLSYYTECTIKSKMTCWTITGMGASCFVCFFVRKSSSQLYLCTVKVGKSTHKLKAASNCELHKWMISGRCALRVTRSCYGAILALNLLCALLALEQLPENVLQWFFCVHCCMCLTC